MMRKVSKVVLTLISLGCWALLVLVIYWVAIDTNPPAKLVHVDDPLGNPSFLLGQDEDLAVRRAGCFSKDADAILSVKFIDGVIYSAPDRHVHIQAGCRTWVGHVDVPNTLNGGQYTYEATLHFLNNPLSHPSVAMQNVTFRIPARNFNANLEKTPSKTELEGDGP